MAMKRCTAGFQARPSPLWSKPDEAALGGHVRFLPQSGHRELGSTCPLCANRDLAHCSKRHRYSITSSARASSVSAVLRFMTDFEIVRSSEIPSDIAPHRLEIHLGVFVKGCGDLLLRLAGP